MSQRPDNIQETEFSEVPGNTGMENKGISPEILAPAISQNIREQALSITEEARQIPSRLYEGLNDEEVTNLKAMLAEDLQNIHTQAAEIPLRANQELELALQ